MENVPAGRLGYALPWPPLFYIQLYARSFQHDKVATLTLVVLLMVVLIEQVSTWCRRRLR